MPPGNQNVWNEDLFDGLKARHVQAMQQKKQSQHQWRDGANAIQEVRKDIRLTSTGKIYNLPNPGGKFTKSVYETCQRIIKGEEPLYPPGYVPLTNAEIDQLENTIIDPYLEKKIGKRSGAHAILMAFHFGNIEASVTKDTICRIVTQLNLCDEVMDADFHQGRLYGAWKAKDTLIRHGYLQEQKMGARMTDRGFRSNGKHLYSITQSGKRAISYILKKWPDTQQSVGPGYSFGSTASVNSTTAPFSNLRSPSTIPTSTTPAKKTKFSDKDEQDLRQWLANAPAGSQKVWEIGKDRRKYLHRLCDKLMMEMPGLNLEHTSSGDQRDRELYVTIHSKPSRGVVTPATTSTVPMAAPTSLQGTSSAQRRLFSDSDTGVRLGGDVSTPAGLAPTEAAGFAAMNRFQYHDSVSVNKRRRQATSNVAQTSTRTGETPKTIDLSGDTSGEEDEMDRKPPAKRRNTNLDAFDYQPGDEVILIDQMGRTTGPFEIIKVHITGHLTITEANGKEKKLEADRVRPYFDVLESSSRHEGNPSIAARSIVDDDNAIDVRKPEPKQQSPSEGNCLEIIDLCGSQLESIQSAAASKVLVNIFIDSRERSRNAAPRELRVGLTTQLQTGSLKDVWPLTRSNVNVEEKELAYGDFAFETTKSSSENTPSRLSVVVERKLVRDLVQRSSNCDHWKQIQRMRDHCQHAIMLIENDTQFASKFDAYGSMGLEPNPSHHVIESDADLYRFVGRAILNSKRIKFIQTKDYNGTFRSIGALALMASESSKVKHDAPTSPPTAASEQQKLKDRLTTGGIHWEIAKAIANEIGSVAALQTLYEACATTYAKRNLVLPPLVNTFARRNDLGSLSSWSKAVFSAFNKCPDTRKRKRTIYQEIQSAFGDAMPCDPADLLSYVYEEESADAAVERAMENSETSMITAKRIVRIELTQEFEMTFPEATNNSFYECQTRSFPSKALKMSIRSGSLISNDLIVHVIEGEKFLKIVSSEVEDTTRETDFVAIARRIAKKLNRIFSRVECTERDHRVVLVCGLSPALVAVRKSTSYRSETKVLCEMVFAQLLLDHEYVILQAIRKQQEEMAMILQQLALACYHYHYLTK